MSGGGGSPIIGYWYRMGIHMGIGRAIDRLCEIKVGDKVAWSGIGEFEEGVVSNGRIGIFAPELFGGEKGEGGIAGDLDVLMGLPDQAVHAPLQSMLGGGVVPAFRGISSLFFNGFVCANNPYPKAWKMRVRRALTGWDGDVFRPDIAQIPLQGQIAVAPEVEEEGFDPRRPTLTDEETVPLPLTNTSSGTLTNALPILSIASVRRFTEDLVFTTTVNSSTSWDIHVSERFISDMLVVQYYVDSGGGVPLLQVNSAFYAGSDDQDPNVLPEVTFTLPAPGVLGDLTRVFTSGPGSDVPYVITEQDATSVSFTVDAVSNEGDVIFVEYTWQPAVTSGGTGGGLGGAATGEIIAMNPAHIIFECATNRDWGRGLPRTRLDIPSFEIAAERLAAECFGLCMRWNRTEELQQFVQRVIDHIGGALYIDRGTGLLKLRLIRDDYDPEEVTTFDYNSGLLSIDEDTTSSSDGLVNEVVLTYHDPITDEDRQVRVQNLASIQAQGAIFSQQSSYPGLPVAALALRVAQRDLRVSGLNLKRFKCTFDRRAWKIAPAGVFAVSIPDRGIDSIILRAGRIDDSTDGTGNIIVTAVQDVFGLPDVSYSGTQPPTFVPISQQLAVIQDFTVQEATFRDVTLNMSTADAEALTPETGLVVVVAAEPTE